MKAHPKYLLPDEAYCPTTAANAAAAAQLFETAHWLCTSLLRKGFAIEPLDDRDCVAQGTDQMLKGGEGETASKCPAIAAICQ
jgi:hypothetical protein